MMPVLFMFYSNFCSISTGWPTASPAPENPGKSELWVLIRNQARRNKTHLAGGWLASCRVANPVRGPSTGELCRWLADLNLG
jgi:hypothetical protein